MNEVERLGRENSRLSVELADCLKEREALLAISSTVNSALELQEALRRICRELGRLIGAETVSVHLHDRGSDLLFPFAGYHIPKQHLQVLSTTPLRLKDQGFYLPLWKDRRPVHSGDVARDPRFSHKLFRLIPHQSGLLLPLILDDEVAGAFYLVWWQACRRFTDSELVLMETISGQVTLLLRNIRLYEEVQIQRTNLADRVRQLEDALARVQQLQGLLPICAWCAGGSARTRITGNRWKATSPNIRMPDSATGSVLIVGKSLGIPAGRRRFLGGT